MIFSRRLYSLMGSAIFIAFVLATLLQITRNLLTSPANVLIIMLLIVAFTLIGTVGWRFVLKPPPQHLDVRLVYLYFGIQSLMFGVIFSLENVFSGRGAASGTFVILLALQSSVLRWRDRLIITAVLHLGMGAISLLFLEPFGVISGTVVSLIINGGVLLLGDLIVSEEQARRELARYADQVEELATMRERNRLAREIHDTLGHYLTIVNVQIEVGRLVLRTDPDQAEQALSHAQTLTREGLSALRRSVAALRESNGTGAGADPLHDSLAQLIAEHQHTGLNVSYHIEGAVRLMPPEISMTLYRVAQEGLTNIRKHARAAHTSISLDYERDCVRISIRDDGVGAGGSTGGFGLGGLQERLAAAGGSLQIQTSPGHGFELRAEVKA